MLLLVASQTYAQELYIKAFGDQNASPIIYLHGGPGYNSTNFEVTTAQALANEGFFVIVYDRRGEGRSDQLKAAYTYAETIEDLATIYETYSVEKAVLLGHSFGGIVATLFAEKHPIKVKEIILLSAPVDLQATFQTIIDSTELIYQNKKDSVNLKYIEMLKVMDKHSLEYSSYCFMHAMANGFYVSKNPTKETLSLYKKYNQSELAKYAQQMSFVAPKGFWDNEQYTSINLTENLVELIKNGLKVTGIYGQEDGLFSKAQIESTAKIIGKEKLFYLENCSHNPYIDQQKQFLEILSTFK